MVFSTIVAVALAGAAGALSACNMAGAGEDTQQGGAALQNSAERHGAEPAPAPAPAMQPNPPPSQ